MPVVAVAGGSGKLGRAIVNGIKQAGKFDVVVLGRQADDEKSKEIGAPIITVDYNSPEAITSVLEQHNVETLISALHGHSPAELELNLISGADKSSTTSRYIPAIWGSKYPEDVAGLFPPAIDKLRYVKALESTSLEWTAVFNGLFLDFYGTGPNTPTYLNPLAIVFDLPNNIAAIPGSGDVPVTFTHTFDVGRFTAALLTKSKWEKESYVIGDKLTLNDFLRVAEEVKGTKFTVEHDPIDKLRTGQATELPSHPHLYAFVPKVAFQSMLSAFGIMFETGILDFKSRTLNDEFPDIKPTTVRELISDAYPA
ncbi:uncharacterized protein DNG_08879 [Cephalotrichum gorgonifer]|uniref:NmrA-like domain-containing protein n=1 Tax=Cephalotrichum gorgonifer TaxID=2041049 RepID=A0AAE8N7H4_9PEZI|nr:uncharacterized protein DNG_08879 [Cephalotrichum gorgonifer]